MTNFSLNSSDEIYSLEKNVLIKTGNVRILPPWKQDIFYELYSLSGQAYQEKLKEAMPEEIKKVNWVRKAKLTND